MYVLTNVYKNKVKKVITAETISNIESIPIISIAKSDNTSLKIRLQDFDNI